jgi:hypothetical protein
MQLLLACHQVECVQWVVLTRVLVPCFSQVRPELLIGSVVVDRRSRSCPSTQQQRDCGFGGPAGYLVAFQACLQCSCFLDLASSLCAYCCANPCFHQPTFAPQLTYWVSDEYGASFYDSCKVRVQMKSRKANGLLGSARPPCRAQACCMRTLLDQWSFGTAWPPPRHLGNRTLNSARRACQPCNSLAEVPRTLLNGRRSWAL